MELRSVKVLLFFAIILGSPKRTTQQGSPGFVFQRGDYIYKIVLENEDRRTWNEAEEICQEQESGHLASITTPYENTWINRKIQLLNANRHDEVRLWVGGTDRRVHGKYEWTDGEPFRYRSAYRPRGVGMKEYEQCVSFDSTGTDTELMYEDCYSLKGYICKTHGIPRRITDRKRFGFEFDYGWYMYKYILLQYDHLSWPEAELYCSATEWGQLLSVTNRQEYREVRKVVRRIRWLYSFRRMWIGATDFGHEGNYTWTDKKNLNFTRWAPGEPAVDRNGEKKNCVAVGSDPHWGKWYKQYCLQRNPFICKIRMCGERTDLGFAIDASGSMTNKRFKKAKEFVKTVIDRFKVGRRGTHVGFIRFSHRVKLSFSFGKYFSHRELYDAIDKIQYSEGGTRTENALKLARTDLFSNKGNYRKSRHFYKLLILLTDGQSEHRKAVTIQARLLRGRGVHVIAVGIGDQVDVEELITIASSPRDVTLAKNFDDLSIKIKAIKNAVCEATDPNLRFSR